MSFFDNYKPESKSDWYAVADIEPGQNHYRRIDGLSWEQVGREKERKPCLKFTPDSVCKKIGIVLSGERHEDLKRIFPTVASESDLKGKQIGINLGRSEYTSNPVLRLVEAELPPKGKSPPPEIVNGPNGGEPDEENDIPF